MRPAKAALFSPQASVGLGLLCVIACAFLQNSHSFFSLWAKTRNDFVEAKLNTRTASLVGLANGDYYVSVGRPRGLCDLKIDGKTLASTRSILPGVRSSLLLGTAFTVSDSLIAKEVSVECEGEGGFKPGFTHLPIIAPFYRGVILQLWRACIDLLMGPFFSLLLVLSLIFSRTTLSNIYKLKFDTTLIFGVVALLYSISLAHYPRLFMAGLPASILHCVLRSLFGLCFYVVCSRYSRLRKSLFFSHFIPIAVTLFCAAKAPQRYDQYYNIAVLVFPILTLFAVFDLFRFPLKSRSGYFIRILAITWAFAQMMDFSVILINVGVYTAPSIVALLTSMIAFVKFYEDKQLEVLASVNSEILLVMDSASTVDDKLKLIGLLLHKRTFYDRISVYADAYVLGLHDSPRERFIRLTEAGYRKDTKPDQLIDFREGRGPLMREALLSGNAMLNQGKMDFAFFSIIPVGQHVIFNISNNESFPDFFATESHELLLGLMPALRTINDRLIEAGSRMAFALESLRILRGDGRWDMEIGSIFLDINDYSDYVEKYGEAYANFVAQVYLPAICQRVRSWAVREGSTAGDAVYLVCISDLMQDRCPMSDAVYKAIAEILRFVEEEGSEMCRLQGFPAIRLQVGANAGAGTVICDAFQVRTSGAVVTEASRLQKASLPGWTFVHVDLANKWPTYGVLRVEQSELELKKMNRLKGCKVGRKKNTNLVA